MTNESFASLYEESLTENKTQGNVVSGVVISINNDMAVIDVGLKAEGQVPLREFTSPGEECTLKVGDSVDVYIENMESRNGQVGLSRLRARREEAWDEIAKLYEAKKHVQGTIVNQVRGGYTVDVMGAIAFLPGSQVDTRPMRNIDHLMNVPQTLEILKMDKERGNIVVSRRSILEEVSAEERSKVIEGLSLIHI